MTKFKKEKYVGKNKTIFKEKEDLVEYMYIIKKGEVELKKEILNKKNKRD